MAQPKRDEDREVRLLQRISSGLKIALIVSIYFSLFTLIILLMIGARP